MASIAGVAFVGGCAWLPAWAGNSRLAATRPGLRAVPRRRRCTPACAVPELGALSGLADGAAGAGEVLRVLFGPLYAPLDTCTPEAVRTLVWLDFRVAVALFVAAPLALFAGSLARGHGGNAGDALTRVLAGYWQASALLLCAVLLHAARAPAAAGAGLLVQGVVAASLNWWEDLLAEIDAADGALEAAFRAWRPAATVAAVAGVALQLPFQGCNGLNLLSDDCYCIAWTEPPTRLFDIVAGGVDQQLVGTLGAAGTTIYLTYLVYYITVVLPRVGRQGRRERKVFSAVTLLNWLGILSDKKEGGEKDAR